jgi:hypothetical protein
MAKQKWKSVQIDPAFHQVLKEQAARPGGKNVRQQINDILGQALKDGPKRITPER